ncbi:disease resistance protein RGA5-like isoform X2 [Triticum dicoccoides]|uniref:disease resistance protein RGA5-like isoform X2 n=1 Tax=Triticum dicoccoides TaxID=85692 RepID=UPI000E7ADFE1|nr:disease resistance protein RGA5-like isoform X2 [Triticum dicoccoides]
MLVGGRVPVALLAKLTKMLTDEYKLHKRAKEGIQYIRDELQSMHAALEKVSEVPPDLLDKQVQIWASKVRKMSYNIEDTIDSFMVVVDAAAGESRSGSSTTWCCVSAKSLLPRTYKARGDIAVEIERIKKEVEEVSKRRERYSVNSIASPAPSDPRLLALYEDEAKLVGIDRSREEIIKLLSMEGEGEGASEQKVRLVSIVGPPGMGKTTLANAVYQKLEEQYDCTAFVSVSLHPDVKNILSSILRQVTSKIIDDPDDKDKDKRLHHKERPKHYGNTATWSEKEVIDKIRHALEKRRYLILIDDIWDEQPWKVIKCVLVENNLGSKVIMTTRNVDVARSCCSSDKVDGIVHVLERLSDSDSEQLFYYKIFGEDGCPTDLKVISQEILEKCEGWPLGIIAIASLLANKPAQTKDQWCSVYNSISTGLENNHGVKDMRLILSLSYRDMPVRLRACLLYLSIFQEDQIIGRDDLIRRWVAEDIVQGRQDENLYELGDKYFNELINRSMIQSTDVDAFGRAQACRVHDLVLEYITFLSAEEDFVTILNGQQPFPPQPNSIHRLSLRNSKGEHGIPHGTKRLPHVRTLVVSSRAIDSMPSLSIFSVLRVLDVEHCTSPNIKCVGNLVHLRYLRLSQEFRYHSDVCIKLPEEIGNLQFLQTLDLKEARIKELPSTVVQLRQVRVLEISLRELDRRSEKRLLQWLCNLKQLEALYIFAQDYSLDFMLQVDCAPSQLRRFAACARQNEENSSPSTFVYWMTFTPFTTLPEWINSSLSHLSNLSIAVKILRQVDLGCLGGLPALRSLYLQVIEVPTKERLEITESTGHEIAFCCLVNLKVMSRAMGLAFRPGAMKGLQRLFLTLSVAETKDEHGDFNLGLENLTSLQALDIELDCRCATTSEVQAAEDAMRMRDAADLTASHPTCLVRRYFVGEMRCDQEEQIPELETMTIEDAGLARIGPCGEGGGRAFDIKTMMGGITRLVHGAGMVA